MTAGEEGNSSFQAAFEATCGRFVVTVHPDWAPLGAARFRELVESGFFDGARFFRVIAGFMAQFGISGDPSAGAGWRARRMADDPVVASNTRGRVAFAAAGPGTRTTQLFISFGDNSRLDAMGFAPIGEVTDGLEAVDRLCDTYGEGAPTGRGPAQDRLQAEGEAYLAREFPDLDRIVRTRIVGCETGAPE